MEGVTLVNSNPVVLCTYKCVRLDKEREVFLCENLTKRSLG